MKNSEYFILSLIVYANLFFVVTSKSVSSNLAEAEKEPFEVYCPTVEFFRNSNFTKPCTFGNETLLCSGLYDLGAKWCLISSHGIKKLPKIENATFDLHVSKVELDEVKKFCSMPKNCTDKKCKNDTSLVSFFNDVAVCLQNCLDPYTENKKPKKLCSALAWLEATMNTPDKILQKESTNTESKPEVLNKPAGKASNLPISSDDETVGTTKIKDGKENNVSENKKVYNPVNKTADTPEVKNTVVISDQQKEKLSKNNQQVSETKIDPNLNNEKKDNEQVSNKKDGSSVLDTNVNSETPQSPNIDENTEVRPDTNQNPETGGSKTDKKTESSSGKAGNVQKNEDVKSSTISENTNDKMENIPRDDGEIAPPISTGDEQVIGQQNQELDFSRKIISRYPGKKVEEESHIFSYFVAFSLLFVCCYIGYLNKKKILAILLEGRRSRNGRGRRRPSTANYRKLDCNLEEAVTSQCNSNVTNVIY